MATKELIYGWFYDKTGKKRIVNAPTFVNGKTAKAHTKTVTGKIPDNVGYPGFADKKTHEQFVRTGFPLPTDLRK